jgi:hypothetical protein
MSSRKHYASPIRFDEIADDEGIVFFQETATTGDKIELEVGNIYVQTQSPCRGTKRFIDVKVSKLNIPEKEQPLLDFLDYRRGQRGTGKPIKKPKIEIKENRPTFLDCDPCVPSFDFECGKPQEGYPAPNNPKVLGAHFILDVTLSGFSKGDRVSGYVLLEVKKPS